MRENTHYRSAWFTVFVLLTASVAAPLNQFKVPPILPLLMDAFGLSVGRVGLLMSVFALTGLILAIPAGFIFQKLGYRITGLLAVGSVIVGASIGAVSTNTSIMLISRVIEGVGMSFMTVVAPAVIAIWFVADERGTPMGVWATWFPLGSTSMFLVAPLIVGRWNWQGVWWFGCSFALVAWLLYYFFIKPAPVQFTSVGNSGESERVTGRDLRAVLRNRDLWLISFLFCCFTFTIVSFVTWTPTFLNAVRGASLARASFLISLVTMFSIVSLPISGWISDRMGSRKVVCVIPMVLLMALWPLAFFAREGLFLLLVIAIGLVGGFVPTGVFSAGSEVVGDERLTGMAMAVIMVGQNAGMLLGPLVFGWTVEATGGWQIPFWTLVPVCGVGAIAGWMAKMR
jgi:MFS family permease